MLVADIARAILAANENSRRPPVLPTPTAGGHDGGMPPDLPERVAILDTHVAHIREDISTLKGDVRDIRKDMRVDFRLTWAGLFVVAIGLAGMMAKGFKWL